MNNLNTIDLIKKLQVAYCDEWLAHIQYFTEVKTLDEINCSDKKLINKIKKELTEHARDEYNHLNWLSDRIKALGGQIIINPRDFIINSSCGYIDPIPNDSKNITFQALKSEQCAIDYYSSFLKDVKFVDPITYDILNKILDEELEHEFDLQVLIEELNYKKGY